MGVYINGMEMPTSCSECPICYDAILCPITQTAFYDMNHEEVYKGWNDLVDRLPNCPLVPVPPHGRLIDADELWKSMYHEAFETDSPMQKWDSGCWIRYKIFEQQEEAAPTIIPAEEG